MEANRSGGAAPTGAAERSFSKAPYSGLVDRAIELCASYYGVTPQQVCSRHNVPGSRRGEVVRARQLAMYLIHQRTRLTLKAIGGYFGGRDHTTVMHGVGQVSDQLTLPGRQGEGMRQDLAQVEAQLAQQLQGRLPGPYHRK